MRNVIALTLLLPMLCAACASNLDQPVVAEVSTRTVTANVPAPVACITAEDLKKAGVPSPTGIDLTKAAVDQKVDALAADAIAARDAAKTANALLLKCSQPPERKTP